tara:strand:+ start:554 stop:820 length:267 start_codon:yes stop_codon:yes gene_type:complete
MDNKVIHLTDEGLRKLVEEATAKGARAALKEIGLSDKNAGQDVRELRNLLDAWRGAKKTMGQTVVRMITTAILVILAVGVYAKLGVDK